jgi:hypothetical protein
MTEQKTSPETQELVQFIVGKLKSGIPKSGVVKLVVEKGFTQEVAQNLVDSVESAASEIGKTEAFSSESVAPAIIVGLIVAIVGGAIWGGVVIGTGYEIGYLAWGLGGLAGYGVVLAARGQKGLVLQIIAVASSLVGILIGKYASFFYFLKQGVVEKYGADAAQTISLFSPKVFSAFMEVLPRILSGHDALWVILAVITAWRIPKPAGLAFRKS